jgi:limonene-1,2-epoxide hydrolase
MTETEVVQAFLAELEDGETERALALCADDVVYQNVPLPADRGKAAVEKTLGRMGKVVTGFEARVVNIAANGPVVLTERIDVLSRGDFASEFWVCGTFEVHDGRITLWRDYFDWTTFFAAGVKGAGKAAFAAVNRALGR